MEPEQQFKDAAREWLESDGAAPAWVEHHLLPLAAEMQRQAARCVREYSKAIYFDSFSRAAKRFTWAFPEEQEVDDD